ncbi:RagB/SusD family nutrient uptake outer membrane protein [Chitinophaga filiformis]|uniref:RagB/SusD family nutrient uptake outer membrane protein n=1 Tax=Chitinophaga filiformis TaxID=104663 RepID=A0ABY4I6T8_CHIFI|nr:RagB/SusD family nutrient uptake outer membrane protein [Chitinophaga filiformis]UPK71795.1 RagB/SusD family nutrient uptake outer membrane protein [Chitinophaga filiformis]
MVNKISTSRVHYRGLFLLIIGASIFAGCRKFLEVKPPSTSLNADNVYRSNATAISVLTNVYSKLSQSDVFYGEELTSVQSITGILGDELNLYSEISIDDYVNTFRNNLSSSNIIASRFWNNCYNNIFIINSALEGLTQSESLTKEVRQQLIGEAKFMRAFFYFYLLNLYGEVPLILTTDYKVNSNIPRADTGLVWNQIKSDLIDAKELLSSDFRDISLLSKTSERVRPTRWSASALLSRVYLYTGEYNAAISEATNVINEKNLFDTVEIEHVFLKNNREAIWQLQPVDVGFNTREARTFVIPPSGFTGESYPVYMSANLIESFDLRDKRLQTWVGSISFNGDIYRFPYKYKLYEQTGDLEEYSTVLRLAEQFLIRAEARLRVNDLVGAVDDINIIRKRAGLDDLGLSTPENILKSLIKERQLELFSEWGHRWFDMKRLKIVDDVMTKVDAEKGAEWSAYKQQLPIPYFEMRSNPSLVQNNGY